jgi:hypothetical protein
VSEPNPSACMSALEPEQDNRGASSNHSISTVETIEKPAFSFDGDLAESRVYKRVIRKRSTSTFQTRVTAESRWSQLSGLSLSQISCIAVVRLPIHTSELPSSYWPSYKYNDGSMSLHHAARKGNDTTVRMLVEIIGIDKEARITLDGIRYTGRPMADVTP